MNTIEKVLNLIENTGKTDNSLEKEIGLSRGAINNWRSQKGKPSFDALVKISNYFDISLDFFADKTKKDTPINIEVSKDYSELQNKLLKCFDALDEGGKYQALGYIEVLADKASVITSSKIAK